MLDQPWIKLNNQITQYKENGALNIEKDKEAVRSYFIDYVNKKALTFETIALKVRYLIENNYYIDFYAMYSASDIDAIFQIVYDKKFRFGSYMSAYKFYNDYALRSNDGDNILEMYEDRVASCALYLAQGNAAMAKTFAETMIAQEYQPATPTFLNAGRKRAGS